MCFLVHPAHFMEIRKVCEMLSSESTKIKEEKEEGGRHVIDEVCVS